MAKVPTELLLLSAVAQAVLPIRVIPAGVRALHEDEVLLTHDSIGAVPDQPSEGELQVIEAILEEKRTQAEIAAIGFYMDYHATETYYDDEDTIPDVYYTPDTIKAADRRGARISDDFTHEDKEVLYAEQHGAFNDEPCTVNRAWLD